MLIKLRNILAGLTFISLFFITITFITKKGKTVYEFKNYKKTIDSSITGTVKRIVRGKNLFGAQFGLDSNNYYGFTYYKEHTSKQWLKEYPNDFIIEGDSIIKKENNDTFIVIRSHKKWTYILPKDSL